MKKWLKKNKRNLYLIIGFVLVSAVWVYAASVPYPFQSGQPASASQVNANFQYLADRSWERDTGSNDLYYNNGNVGIGTTSPAGLLDVRGGLTRLTSAATTNGRPIQIFSADTKELFGIITGTDGVGTGGEIYLNQDGADIDFRIEAVGTPNAFFVDANTGNVGIGTANPTAALEIAGENSIKLNGGAINFGQPNTRIEITLPTGQQWQFRNDGTIWYNDGSGFVQKL